VVEANARFSRDAARLQPSLISIQRGIKIVDQRKSEYTRDMRPPRRIESERRAEHLDGMRRQGNGKLPDQVWHLGRKVDRCLRQQIGYRAAGQHLDDHLCQALYITGGLPVADCLLRRHVVEGAGRAGNSVQRPVRG